MIALNPEPSPGPESDVGLMLRTREGDRAAFDQLVARHRGRTIRLLISMSVEPCLAEDLAQDLFLRVYRARKSYLPTAKFSTWIGSITRNLVINSRRDRRRARTESSLEFSGAPGRPWSPVSTGLASRDGDPVQTAVARERREVVCRAMAGLNERERAAVVRFHFAGHSYQRIADDIRTTPKAVKSLLARARSKLRQSLAHSPIAAEVIEETGGSQATAAADLGPRETNLEAVDLLDRADDFAGL